MRPRRRALAAALAAGCCAVTPAVATAAQSRDAGQAAGSLRSVFPELTEAPAAPALAPGTAVTEYVGSDTARIVDARGRHSVLLSSAPLRSRVGGAGLKPLSLELRGSGPGEVRPANPAVPVTIATDPSQGFTLGPDADHLVTIVPLRIRSDVADATVLAGQLLFAGAHAASDLLIRPSIDGVQTFDQLTGPAAPERFDYRLELAPRQTAELVDGSVIIRQDGVVIVQSLPAVAVDADRRDVPVKVSLDGGVVRLDVPHRDRGFRYPIAVDPDWTSSYNYHDQPGLGREGWHAAGEAEYYDAFINNVWDPVADPQRKALGFFIRPKVIGASRVFPTGVGRTLFFNAPGTTHIRSVTYNNVSRFNDRDRQTLRLGLYGDPFGEADDVFEAEELSEASVTLPRDPFLEDEDSPAISAVMWMFSSPCNQGQDLNCPPVIDAGTRTLLKVGSVQLVLTDFDFPTTAAPGSLRDLQDRWTNATDSRTLDPSAVDEGSGVRDLSVSVQDGGGTHAVRSIQSPCHPEHNQTDPPQDNAICPRTLSLDQPLSLNTGQLPEGRSTFTVDAADLAANTAAAGGTATTFSVYLDRNQPTATASGPLHDAADTWLRPIRPGTVTVTGSDTVGGQGNTSGIAHNHLTAVDGSGATVYDRDADTCTPPGPIATPCDAGKASTFNVDPRTLPEGPITFSATSTDLAGNVSQAHSWIVRLDRTPPAARATGDLLGLTSQHTSSTTPTSVTLHGRDAASGVARLQLVASNSDGEKLLADIDTCGADDLDAGDRSCPHTPTVEVVVDPTELPDGPTTFIARAIDHAGIKSVDNQDWDTYVDHTPPEPPDSVNITQTSNTSVQVTWPTVIDQPLGSGNVSYEYLVTAGGQPIGGWQPTNNPYAQVGGLPPGVTISVLVRAIDSAHNQSQPASGLHRLRQVGPISVSAGTGGCVVPAVTIGQLPWLPFIDSVWDPGGQITTLATVTCGLAVPENVTATVTWPEFRGSVCLERNVGNGWRRFGLCTSFNPRNPKVKSRVVNRLRLYEVSTFAPDIGHCTVAVQGNARFRTVVNIRSRIDVRNVKGGFDTPVDSRDDRTIRSGGERQHCQTELEGWNRLALTNPARARKELKGPPEAILGRVLGKTGDRDTRPIDKVGDRSGWEAHHIIPASSPRAASARISGFRCHVHPNSKLNGIWLRGFTRRGGSEGYGHLTPDQQDRVLHSLTFRDDYYQRINALMAGARRGAYGCDESRAEELLKAIDHQLANGTVGIHAP